MNHPGTNAELARLAYVDALRQAQRAVAAEEEPAPAPPREVTPLERLTALLLPELPTDLWVRARTPAATP